MLSSYADVIPEAENMFPLEEGLNQLLHTTIVWLHDKVSMISGQLKGGQ